MSDNLPCKLLVDGRVVRDEFPDWSEALKVAGWETFPILTKECSFVTHRVKFRGCMVNSTVVM